MTVFETKFGDMRGLGGLDVHNDEQDGSAVAEVGHSGFIHHLLAIHILRRDWDGQSNASHEEHGAASLVCQQVELLLLVLAAAAQEAEPCACIAQPQSVWPPQHQWCWPQVHDLQATASDQVGCCAGYWMPFIIQDTYGRWHLQMVVADDGGACCTGWAGNPRFKQLKSH